MITVTASDFKSKFGYYIRLVETEDIMITKNGKSIAKISNPKVSAVDKLSGILKGKVPEDIDRHSLKESRLEKAQSRFEDKKGDNEEAAAFTYEVVDMPSLVYSYDDTANVLSLIYTLIDGVFATSEPDYEGDVLGLSSIYGVSTEGSFKVSVLGRYTDSDTLTEMDTTFDTIAQLSGFAVESEDMTNLWKQEDNAILKDEDFAKSFESYHPERGALYSFTSSVCRRSISFSKISQ